MSSLFHLVEGVNVGSSTGRLPCRGESHAEEGEAVSGHAEVRPGLLLVAGRVHGAKLRCVNSGEHSRFAMLFEYILVLLPKMLGDVETGRGGLAGDLDADLGGGLGGRVGYGLTALFADVTHAVSPLVIASKV